MVDILNYVCHGLTASEKTIRKVAKRTRCQGAAFILLSVACIGLTKIVYDNARDIVTLKRKIEFMEELQQEKGA